MYRKLVVLVFLLICSCSSQDEGEYKEAQKNIAKGHSRVALNLLDRIVKRNTANNPVTLEAAREASRLAFYDLKDYSTAIGYFRYIVLHSENENERLEAQKQIASIFFNNLQNYQNSIIEYSKLQQMTHNDLEAAQYTMNIARAQFYLNNFYQAESEIESLLQRKSDEKIRAGAILLKGNIHIAKKEFSKAIEIFKTLISSNPQFAMEENIGLILAVCYEENNNFKEAIKVLESYRGKYNPPEYIELRIKRLQERQKNAPGAKGYKK